MSRDRPPIDLHVDLARFREALLFTESATGFSARLVEKDYFASLVLYLLNEGAVGKDSSGATLAFKGGTCLSKVHTQFFRMSEDLDFAISFSSDATRGERRKAIAPIRIHLDWLIEECEFLHAESPLIGADDCRHYSQRLSYQSMITGEAEFLKIEITLREPIVEPLASLSARTLIREPARNVPAVADIVFPVYSLREALAEKIRAAMTRREPAIRDFFDIAFAIREGHIRESAPEMIALIRRKLAVPGNSAIDLSAEKHEHLRRQLGTELKPVLRGVDFDAFSLDAAFATVTDIARSMGMVD